MTRSSGYGPGPGGALRRRQRGEGRIGFLIGIIIAAIVVFLGIKFIPVKIKTYQFADYMRDEAQRTAWTKDEEALRKLILEKARMLELPLDPKNLKISIGAGVVKINARYDIPIDLKVTEYVWKFDQTESAPLF